jgi:LCP family protein required for cell wall assembly
MKKGNKFLITIIALLFLSLTGAGVFSIHYLVTGEGKDPIFINNPINVLLMVGDKDDYNTDTMMVVNYDPKEGRASFLSVPRDTKVFIHDKLRKLNAGKAMGGTKLTTNLISDLLKVNINYYVHIKIKTFTKVVDMMGGVDYYVPLNLKYEDPSQGLHINLKRGMQHLDGDKAEQLLRFRKPQHEWSYSQRFLEFYDGSDAKRTERQLDFLKEFIKQKASLNYLSTYNDVIKTVFDETDTNINMGDALKLILNIDRVDFKNVKTFRISGDYKMISGSDYFIYDNRIFNPIINKSKDASGIIKKYFTAVGPFINTNVNK